MKPPLDLDLSVTYDIVLSRIYYEHDYFNFEIVNFLKVILIRNTTMKPPLDLDLSITYDIVLSRIYYEHDYFNFEIVNFLFIDGDVPHSLTYGVFISQLIPFSRVFSYVCDFNNRDKFLKQCYKIIKFVKLFFPNSKLIVKCNVGFKLIATGYI